MAVKDEKMVDADAEQAKLKKQKLKKKGKKGEEDKEADMSEEDLELKKNLELMLERAKDSDAGVQRTALEGIAREIRYALLEIVTLAYTKHDRRFWLCCINKHVCMSRALPDVHSSYSYYMLTVMQGVHHVNDICAKAIEVSEVAL